MPRYDVDCPEHGVNEVVASIGDAGAGALTCPVCGDYCPQHFGAAHFPGMRIDAADQDARHPERVADGSAKFNLGLRGVDTVVGTRRNGKPKLAYRPLTHHEVGSNHNAREIAKRQGMELVGGGAYRSIGGR